MTTAPPRLALVPCSLKDANAFVARLHRHSAIVVGHKFSIAASLCTPTGQAVIVGVAIVGRPVSRRLDDGHTLEVTRVCTDGTRNACSFLYGAAKRAANALGFARLITYTTEHESGASLRAVGWISDGVQRSLGTWNRPLPLFAASGIADPRKRPHCRKIRWRAP